MIDLHFEQPGWVHGLWLVPALAAALWYFGLRGQSALETLVGSALQGRLVSRVSNARRLAALALLCLSASMIVLALMRPQWGLQLVATPRVGAEIMICLDVSKSMLAEDVAPNRLERAKAELRDLLEYLDGDHVGLIAFAGRATVLSPLTPDFSFLRLVLDEAGPDSVTRGGTRLEEPIRKAVAGFGEAGDVSRSILLITDGEDHDSFPMEAAKAAAERGIRVLAIGFGDENGSQIIITDPRTGARTPVRTADGDIVRSRLDGDMLRQIALTTGGAYVPAGTGVLDLESIYERHVAALTRGTLDGATREIRHDAFQWALLAAMLSLLGAVMTISARPGRPSAADGTAHRAGRTGSTARSLAALFLAGSLIAAPLAAADDPAGLEPASTAALASTDDGTKGDAPDDARETDNSGDATESTEDPSAEYHAEDAAEDKETPREIFNRALESMQAADLEQAQHEFERARLAAGHDGELRFRSLYNLGWLAASQAQQVVADDPERALELLGTSADRFRQAVALRHEHEPSRTNLEIVLLRAAALADSLSKKEPGELLERIEALIEQRRTTLRSLAPLAERVRDADGPQALEPMRADFRDASAAELEFLADTDEVVRAADAELRGLEGKADEERTSEEQMRVVHLDGVLHYLQRARAEMGGARSRLRRMDAEPAYRRATAVLAELKRARAQLQDPVTVLEGLLTDGNELLQNVGLLARSQSDPLSAGSMAAGGMASGGKNTRSPAWLTGEYLTESAATLRDRTNELHGGIESAVNQADAAEQAGVDPAPGMSPEDAAAHARAIERWRIAEPLIAGAAGHLSDARAAAEAETPVEAVEPVAEALLALSEAREQFLELEGLIETTYADQIRIETALKEAVAARRKGDREAETALAELSGTLAEMQTRNRERGKRIQAEIALRKQELEAAVEQAANEDASGQDASAGGAHPEEAAAEAQRLEVADRHAVVAQAAMHDAVNRLEELHEGPVEETSPVQETSPAQETSPEEEPGKDLAVEATTPSTSPVEAAARDIASPDMVAPDVAAPDVATPDVATQDIATDDTGTPRPEAGDHASGSGADTMPQQPRRETQPEPLPGNPIRQNPAVAKPSRPDPAPPAIRAVGDALSQLEELRRLFLSIVELIEDTARRQMELIDRTEEATATAVGEDLQEAVGPLQPPQRELSTISSAIAEGLAEQARASEAAAMQGSPGEQGNQIPPENMRQASAHVATAASDMENAAEGLTGDEAALQSARDSQLTAIEELLKALALLQPPEQQPQDGEQQQEENSEQEQQQQGEQEEGEQEQAPADPANLLQQIREREAERRNEKAPEGETGYQPVEKDW